jgi:hypothetical protein
VASNVVSLVALFVALGGVGYAASVVRSVFSSRNARTVDGLRASSRPKPHTLLALNGQAKLPASVLPVKTGATGAAGAIGPAGATGPQGATGPRGPGAASFFMMFEGGEQAQAFGDNQMQLVCAGGGGCTARLISPDDGGVWGSYSDGAYAGAVKGSTYISGATPGTIALARATSADTEAQGHFTFYLYNGTTWDIEIQLLYATNGNTILTGTAVPGGQYVTTSERSGR